MRLPEDYFRKNKVSRLQITGGVGHPTPSHPVQNVMDSMDITKVKTQSELSELPSGSCERRTGNAGRRCKPRDGVLPKLSQRNNWGGTVIYATNISSRPQFRTWITWLLVAGLALLLVPASYAGKKDKKKQQEVVPAKKQGIDRSKIDTSKLVWPLPPDLPRIKFISEHFGEPPKPVEAKPKKKKQGWMDRMAGVQQRESGDPTEPSHTLGQPYGIAVDSKGRVFVGDTFVAAVFIFNTEKKEVTFLRNGHEEHPQHHRPSSGRQRPAVRGRRGHAPGLSVQFGIEARKHIWRHSTRAASGIAVDNENRFVYVVDTGNETVFVFDADNLGCYASSAVPPRN